MLLFFFASSLCYLVFLRSSLFTCAFSTVCFLKLICIIELWFSPFPPFGLLALVDSWYWSSPALWPVSYLCLINHWTEPALWCLHLGPSLSSYFLAQTVTFQFFPRLKINFKSDHYSALLALVWRQNSTIKHKQT